MFSNTALLALPIFEDLDVGCCDYICLWGWSIKDVEGSSSRCATVPIDRLIRGIRRVRHPKTTIEQTSRLISRSCVTINFFFLLSKSKYWKVVERVHLQSAIRRASISDSSQFLQLWRWRYYESKEISPIYARSMMCSIRLSSLGEVLGWIEQPKLRGLHSIDSPVFVWRSTRTKVT